jgi:hypothetical protein
MLYKREGLLPESRLKLVLNEDELDTDSEAKKAKK